MRDHENGCRENVELIIQHVDGLLPPERVVELEAHLASCVVCRAELLLQKRIHDALTEEIHPRLSVDFTKLVTKKALETASPARRRPAWVGLAPAFGLLTVTSLLFALPNDFRTMFARSLWPTGSVLSSAVSRVGQVFSGMLPHTGGTPGLNLSGLSGITGPLMLTLLLLLCVLPVVWCFRSVGEVLKE
jgi:anti-sigma factor RsiW